MPVLSLVTGNVVPSSVSCTTKGEGLDASPPCIIIIIIIILIITKGGAERPPLGMAVVPSRFPPLPAGPQAVCTMYVRTYVRTYMYAYIFDPLTRPGPARQPPVIVSTGRGPRPEPRTRSEPNRFRFCPKRIRTRARVAALSSSERAQEDTERLRAAPKGCGAARFDGAGPKKPSRA